MYKRMSLLTAQAGMSREDFVDYWGRVHGPMIAELPGLRGYVQNGVKANLYKAGPDGHAFMADGVVELYFDTIEDMHIAFSSAPSIRIRADEENFLGTSSGYSIDGDTMPRNGSWPRKLIVALGEGVLAKDLPKLQAELTHRVSPAVCEINAVAAKFGRKVTASGPQPVGWFLHLMDARDLDPQEILSLIQSILADAGRDVSVSVFGVEETRFL